MKDQNLECEFTDYEYQLKKRARIRVSLTWDDIWPSVAMVAFMTTLFGGIFLTAILTSRPDLWAKLTSIFN